MLVSVYMFDAVCPRGYVRIILRLCGNVFWHGICMFAKESIEVCRSVCVQMYVHVRLYACDVFVLIR